MEAVRGGGHTLANAGRCSFSALVRATLISALSLFHAACSSIDTRPYPWFQRVQVAAAAAATDTAPARTAGDLATRGISAGVVGSAGAGLAISLLCGPWYIECAAAMVPGLMASGATIGALAGLAGLSPEEAGQVNAYFATLPVRRDLNAELVRAVSALIPPERLAAADADALLTLAIGEIRIKQEASSTFFLQLELNAELSWADNKKANRSVQRHWQCETRTRTVTDWLVNSGRHLDASIDDCVDEFAGRINAAISTAESAGATRQPASTPRPATAAIDDD